MQNVMIVEISEFRNDVDKYLDLVQSEDIILADRGKAVALLSKPQKDKADILSSLVGIAKTDKDISLDEIRSERLSKY